MIIVSMRLIYFKLTLTKCNSIKLDVASVLQEAGDAESRACTRAQV